MQDKCVNIMLLACLEIKMKKYGFTLAETLVALGIIAIGASILAPSLMDMRPDKYKFKVIEQYNLLNDITEQLLSNKAIYYRLPLDDSTPSSVFDSNGILNQSNQNQYGCKGLVCHSEPKAISGYQGNQYRGLCKYPNLVSNMMQLSNKASCNNGKYEGVAKDNTIWSFTANNSYEYTVIITFPKVSGTGCGPYSSNCKHPNKFQFNVDSMGDITGGDSLTEIYIKNMQNIHKSDDLKKLNG